jgi:hypothetical protein
LKEVLMPFLYLPDAVSLFLVFVVLSLLRHSALTHFRQELVGIRNELLLFWCEKGFSPVHPAYSCLRGRIDAAIGFSSEISPARFFFIWRLCRNIEMRGDPYLPPDPASILEHHVRNVEEMAVRQKLRRIQLETDTALGMFFLFGSLSGWLLAAYVLLRVTRRLARRRSKERTDWFFDLFERILSRVGRRAERAAWSVKTLSGDHHPMTKASPLF